MDFATRESEISPERRQSEEWKLDWAIREGASLGLLPTDLYCLTIDELNTFLIQRTVRREEEIIESSWRTINFLGGFFSGKLGDLKKYLPETPARKEEKVQKEEAMIDGLAKLGFKK